MSRLNLVKYFISLLAILMSFFLQCNWSFWQEEKMTRLIDLSPKEETEWSGSVTGTGSSKMIETKWDIKDAKETSPKAQEKRTRVGEKSPKDEKSTDWTWTLSDVDGPKDEKESVQTLINSYILETYKAQWDKILKDMDQSLQKKIPDVEKRIQAYDSIQTTLELRKTRILKVNISEANKDLLSAYFDYMIGSLEKRKEALSE